ncbi:hypothetical protein AMAG_16445 [Allomyces macrogynus ATCC 38327]|uniref:DNA-directed RNA polymerase III subunit RPC3 n=1 Tax=Allomyces macrogynus (strain ATCC 38327) TaxID=578462 RepID=A0A0L0TCR1_ALLM3|nr:hypothetical protein AMAG_16445 [Allomyces macrogynus ATCC 38327]|eukprot:KNE72688.1 hypothetical protein AMAG_16445 [Allomyces macrogynus ATCC 38327]
MAHVVRSVRDILTPHFGEQVTTVACSLALRGRQPLPPIVRHSKLPGSVVRMALLILIQHGLVVHFDQTERSGRIATYYTLLTDRVFLRPRFPRYIHAAKSMFKEEGHHIATTILLHGRLSLKDLLAHPDSVFLDSAKLRDTFVHMVHQRFLLGGDSKASLSKLDVQLHKEREQVAALGLMPSAKDMRQLQASREAQMQEELDNAVMVGMKRKPGTSSNEYGAKAYKAFEVDMNAKFTLNFARFDTYFLREAVITYTTVKINVTAGDLLRQIMTMIDTAALASSSSATTHTVTPAQVAHQLPVTDLPMDYVEFQVDLPQKVADYMDLLDGIDVLVKDTNKDVYAVASPTQLKTLLQQQYLVRHIESRFGKYAARIWRALHVKGGKLEEKQIATVTMLPVNEARSHCYAMVQEGFLEMIPVAKSADRAPTRSFYVLSQDLAKAARNVHAALHQALCNAAERLAIVSKTVETELGASLEARKRAARRQAVIHAMAGGEDPSQVEEVMLEGEELDEVQEKYETAQAQLRAAILRMDRDLLLFE